MKLKHLIESERFDEANEKKIADQIVARVLVNLRNFERQNNKHDRTIDQGRILRHVTQALKMISDGHSNK